VRVAALYDVHGNVPALDAVLADVDAAGVDLIVWGGDVAAGPEPAATIARMRARGGRCVRGNGDRQMVEDFDAGRKPSDTDDEMMRAMLQAVAGIDRSDRDFLASFEPTVSVGGTLFCHGSPRSDDERITRATPPERLAPMLAGVEERLIECGHTHQQFDLRCGDQRVLNAGSVGMPYEGVAAAFWLLLGPEPELRRTTYDPTGLDREFFKESVFEPADPDWVTRYFETGEE
jgi:predicted phosphodiesterase